MSVLAELMENENGKTDPECEVTELRLKVESLKQELKECRAELAKLQKQLNHTERLQKSTESYNEDLRKQVRPYTHTHNYYDLDEDPFLQNSLYCSEVSTTVWILQWGSIYRLLSKVFIYN